jgi:hypothetical protein
MYWALIPVVDQVINICIPNPRLCTALLSAALESACRVVVAATAADARVVLLGETSSPGVASTLDKPGIPC